MIKKTIVLFQFHPGIYVTLHVVQRLLRMLELIMHPRHFGEQESNMCS